MDPLLDFTGKVAVITGAAQGFGQLLAEELAKRGAKLVISDINEVGVHKVADGIAATGAEVFAMKCDVSSAVLILVLTMPVLRMNLCHYMILMKALWTCNLPLMLKVYNLVCVIKYSKC